MFKNTGKVAKFIVAAQGTIATGLEVWYGTDHWVPIVTSAVAAVVVYLVPNTPSVPTP